MLSLYPPPYLTFTCEANISPTLHQPRASHQTPGDSPCAPKPVEIICTSQSLAVFPTLPCLSQERPWPRLSVFFRLVPPDLNLARPHVVLHAVACPASLGKCKEWRSFSGISLSVSLPRHHRKLKHRRYDSQSKRQTAELSSFSQAFRWVRPPEGRPQWNQQSHLPSWVQFKS